MVERELTKAGFEASQINGGGLKITTTFDKKAQDAAVEAAQKYTKESASAADQKASNLHAAVASVDVATGEVIALYGGPDYVKNSRNWATTPRPTASTFKTYALAAGLEDGFSLFSRFNGNTFIPPGDSTPVRNEFRNQYGSAVTLLRATAQSINTAYVDMVGQMDDGPEKTMDMAEAAGAPKGPGWDDNSRLPLGTAEVSPLAQASAYATFANDGVAVPSHVVREVRDAKGKVIYKAKVEEKRAVSSDIAADVTYALSSVVDGGTGRAAQALNLPVAGKTGHQGPGGRHRLGLVRRHDHADLHRGDVRRGRRGHRRPRPVRPSRRQHVLRRHLPRPDLGRLHGGRDRGAAGRGVPGAGVREPGRRTRNRPPRATRRPSPPRPLSRPRPTNRPLRRPTEPTASRPSRVEHATEHAAADDRAPDQPAAERHSATQPEATTGRQFHPTRRRSRSRATTSNGRRPRAARRGA